MSSFKPPEKNRSIVFIRIRRWGKRVVTLLLFWFLVHAGVITYTGLRNKPCSSELGVILGNKVNEDGTLSSRLKARLDKGLELFRSGDVKMLLVSGGLGKEGYYEGDEMKKYLVAAGVPDSLVLVDNKGINTEATARNTARVTAEKKIHRVTIISQYFHLVRCRLLFEKAGLNNCCIASPSYFEWRDVFSITREFAGYYVALLN